MTQEFNFQLVGPEGSGKTSLLLRVRDGKAGSDYPLHARLQEPVTITATKKSGEEVRVHLHDGKSGTDFDGIHQDSIVSFCNSKAIVHCIHFMFSGLVSALCACHDSRKSFSRHNNPLPQGQDHGHGYD